MSQDDFNFNGNTTQTRNAYRVQNSAWRQGNANGNAASTNGGEAMLGQGSVNSLLPDPLASSSAGDYCRSMVFSEDTNTSTSGRYWSGVACLGTASGGPLYPVTGSPADGTLIAYSLRAFLRVDQTGSLTADPEGVGTYIGITAKCRTNSTTDRYNSSTHQNMYWDDYGTQAGYSVCLSSRNHQGLDATYQGNNVALGHGGVRLLLGAPYKGDCRYQGSGDGFWEVCSGSFAFNTWYHVRMDVVPASGQDTINVYTASITDTVGSETWVAVASYVVPGAADYYYPWDDADYNKVGYYWGAASSTSGATQSPHNCHIDRFQFLNKDISGSA